MSEGTIRWVFYDPKANETYVVPINPNQMGDPEARPRPIQFGARSRISNLGTTAIRSFESPSNLPEWTFGGVIHTKAHHDNLLRWAQKPEEVHITDHLGRTWVVLVKSFEPTERRQTIAKPWRFTYSMRVQMLGRLP